MAPPGVWLLLGRKAGDNAQVRALAAQLGWPSEEKAIVSRGWQLLPQLLLRATLAGIDRAASSPLAPPWPDLVVSAGRRNEPVARWIRARSAGAARLVHIGRPWAHPGRFDLVIATPQYFLEGFGNVLVNPLPLHDPPRHAAPPPAVAGALADLPRPWTVVLVGGDSGPFVFTRAKAQRLAARLESLRARAGGALLLSNSARTPPDCWRALLDSLAPPLFAHDVHGGAPGNPYAALLCLADRLVVTGESMSMLAEATATGKPVHIFDMGDGGARWWLRGRNFRAGPLSHRLAMRLAPRRLRRDVGRIQSDLVRGGLANWLGEEEARPAPRRAAGADLRESARRVRQLFD